RARECRSPRWPDASPPLSPTARLLDHERDAQVDAPLPDTAVVATHDLDFVHPRTLDALDRLGGLGQAALDRILDAGGGRGVELDDFGNGHVRLLDVCRAGRAAGTRKHARRFVTSARKAPGARAAGTRPLLASPHGSRPQPRPGRP